MKTIELFIMLIGVTFGISKFAYGQVYSPNTYIYEDISGDDWYILLKLAGDKAFMDAGYALNGFRRYDLVVGYRRSSSWADDQNRWSHRPNYEQKSENHNLVFHYNANMSSKYSKIIYTLVTSSRWKYFFSISDDKNTVITWQEDPSGHISSFHCTSGTTTWIRVDPDVFKPKSESDKYEFLND